MPDFKPETIKVTTTVTVTMTPAQQDAYRKLTGAGMVAIDVVARLRPEMAQVLLGIAWLQQCATVTISRPRAELAPKEAGTAIDPDLLQGPVLCAKCRVSAVVAAGYGAGFFCARCIGMCHEALEFDHCCVICATPDEARAFGYRIPAGWGDKP